MSQSSRTHFKQTFSNTVFNAFPEERHVNVSRYLSGEVCPKDQKRQLNEQLRNLLNVNDAPTLPNPSGSGTPASKVLFSKLISKVTS